MMILRRPANYIEREIKEIKTVKANKSNVMKRAWACKRKHSEMSFSECLTWSWKVERRDEIGYQIVFTDGTRSAFFHGHVSDENKKYVA